MNDYNYEDWRDYVTSIIKGIVLYTIAGFVYDLLDSTLNAGTSFLMVFGGYGNALAILYIVKYLSVLAVWVGYLIFLVHLSKFARIQNSHDCNRTLRVRNGSIFLLISTVIAVMPFAGKPLEFILSVIGYIFIISGYYSLSHSDSFPRSARGGASILFASVILELLAGLFSWLPVIGGAADVILSVIAFICVLVGWSRIKNASVVEITSALSEEGYSENIEVAPEINVKRDYSKIRGEIIVMIGFILPMAWGCLIGFIRFFLVLAYKEIDYMIIFDISNVFNCIGIVIICIGLIMMRRNYKIKTLIGIFIFMVFFSGTSITIILDLMPNQCWNLFDRTLINHILRFLSNLAVVLAFIVWLCSVKRNKSIKAGMYAVCIPFIYYFIESILFSFDIELDYSLIKFSGITPGRGSMTFYLLPMVINLILLLVIICGSVRFIQGLAEARGSEDSSTPLAPIE